MPKQSAVEILVCKPDAAIPSNQKGVHENLWIKQRFEQYVSIGVYLEGSDLKYYFFENCDQIPQPKIYASLVELKKELPSGLENIFDNTPKLFMMGHGRGDSYGLGNGSVEIYGPNLDKIITDFEQALSEQHDEIFVTLEVCNTDNRAQAAKEGWDKTFLERMSERHQKITFCGTGPWDPNNPQTGYRSSGGFPTLNAPVTAVSGGIWKYGNRVIFYHGNDQVIVKKSTFASTQTAKELKVNTIKYAREILNLTALDKSAKEEIIKNICASRDVLKIEDLVKITDFPQDKFEDQEVLKLLVDENRILEKEKNNYIARVQEILERAESRGKFSERDLLVIALGLKNITIFKSHEDLRDKILDDNTLLQLVMVSCGKVLIAGQSNDSLLDLLLEKGVDINSVDEKGMTALHYSVQNFYNYREEPLNLINKLLDCGADLKAEDKAARTPWMLANAHSQKGNVMAGANLLKLLESKLADAVPVNNKTNSALNTTQSSQLRLPGYQNYMRHTQSSWRKVEDKQVSRFPAPPEPKIVESLHLSYNPK